MKWKIERDALIAQTLAFVQSVARKKDDARNDLKNDVGEIVNQDTGNPDLGRDVVAAALDAARMEPRKIAEPLKNARMLPADPSSDFRTEIQNRVANFRAHQERFHREREEYFSTTLGKARSKARDDVKPSR
jgi:hypothetical protein